MQKKPPAALQNLKVLQENKFKAPGHHGPCGLKYIQIDIDGAATWKKLVATW